MTYKTRDMIGFLQVVERS